MENIISVSGLHKRFGETHAVRGIDFEVDGGSLFAFLGQNGAGKSTTINILLGLLQADGGRIDYSAFGSFENFKREIGVVFQNNVFDDFLTVEENLLLCGELYLRDAKSARARLSALCELLSLGEVLKKRFRTLSGGQQRKAEIARALFHTPRMLFLDEPTTGLDPKTRAEVWQLLHEIRREGGMTIFLTTHYMEETADADKVVILHRGEKVCEGSPAELKAAYSQDRLRITPKDAAALENALTERGCTFERIAGHYAVTIQSTAESIVLLYALRENVRFYEAVKGSMDDVFLNAVGENIGTAPEGGQG